MTRVDELTFNARREVCNVSCTEKCAAFIAGTIDYENPKAACPRPWILRWGCYGPCNGATPPVSSPLPAAGAGQTLANGIGALARLGGAIMRGEPVRVSAEILATREVTCASCPEWDAAAYQGLGKCRACGCTALKRHLATEKCPRGKWPGPV